LTVYGWIWRHLPFGTPGKLIGSLLLATAAVALLWYVVFPAIDPHLPFNNSGQVTGQFDQVTQPNSGPSGSGQPSGAPRRDEPSGSGRPSPSLPR
jgi:hypothetical protein